MRRAALVFTDGATKANPKGAAAYGVWIVVMGRFARGYGVYLGEGKTNNEAEYAGLLAGLRHARAIATHEDVDEVWVRSDSKLAVFQTHTDERARWACTKEHLVPLRNRGLALRAPADVPLHVEHVMREFNTMADALANAAIAKRARVHSLPLAVETVADDAVFMVPRPAPRRKRKR